MVEAGRLREALEKWRTGSPVPLIRALGYEPVGMAVPEAALPDFGLDPSGSLTLEVAGRHAGFTVFRVTLPEHLDAATIRHVASALYRRNPARRALLIFEGNGLQSEGDGCLVFASWGLGPGPFRLQKLWIDPAAPRPSELDILAGLSADDAATPSELALAHARALDREQVTRKFFNEFRRHRAELAIAMTGVPLGAERDRLDLSLILLNRLLFIYFIQRKGWLAGDSDYLRALYNSALSAGIPFYRKRLKPLFFGALNRPPGSRGRIAHELGDLPYLNGGLFERYPLERQHARLDVPDDSFEPIFNELLDKYQFTLREDQAADQDVAVDPEMLGRVFEGLMAEPVRGSTGAFFTPRSLVDRLAVGAISAHLARATECDPDLISELMELGAPNLDDRLRARLAERVRSIRVLDPAVGSGAFLLAALHLLENLRDRLEGQPSDASARFERRQEIIRENLYGVDINGAAVRLCELRLWLALIVDLDVHDISQVPPLPNLDLKIRQGDVLVDPIDFLLTLGDLDDRNLLGRWQRSVTRLQRRRHRYFRAQGPAKHRLGRSLRRAERELALNFLAELAGQINARRGDLRSTGSSRNLFGERSGLDRGQRRALAALDQRRKEISRLIELVRNMEELPFFSFPIHFADPEHPSRGFDVILGNPPWVRTHRWTNLSRARLKERFEFLRNAGWKAGSRLAGVGRGFGAQLDLSALFLERSLELLAEDGALGFLLPAKLVRSLYGSAVRQRLLRSTSLIGLEDCSLATKQLFDATTYPLAVLLTSGAPVAEHEVRIRLHTRRTVPAEFHLPQSRLSLIPEDDESPWVLVPPSVRAVLDRMRAAGPPLGATPGRRPARGIFTGANSVFVGEVQADPDNAGLVPIRLSGSEVHIEAARLRPALRGEDLRPWRFTTQRAVIWTHGDDGRALPSLPESTLAHVRRHERLLRARPDLRAGQPPWTLFRARPAKWALRVAWRDIASDPGAAVVPSLLPFLGGSVPIVSLNTIYQIPTVSEDEAHLLAALLNSVVARAFLKAIAERASGGYFRFLGWTVAQLPFPDDPHPPLVAECVRLSRLAHARGALAGAEQASLDRIVGRLYGLGLSHLKTLQQFDSNLSG
ncbi:MAG: N-6 DNA methylase, partial [Gemmatimonadota bacterium]